MHVHLFYTCIHDIAHIKCFKDVLFFFLFGALINKIITFLPQDAVENKLDTKDWPHQSECPAAWNGSGAVRYSSFFLLRKFSWSKLIRGRVC